ncbi:hypothetical protein ACIRD3_34680 [Kitasatospora sp. NPDC093550]|uniref:hypothetical protein n=1 Tax=Kitasatospora sp. NPDC093550 TaxID=3364089 RepID=UPI0037F90AAB
MTSIDALIPFERPHDPAALRARDADELARYAADPEHHWFRRRACAEALTGRVPEERVPGLLAVVRDGEETAELRVALLDLLAPLGDRAGLLSWLRHPDRGQDGPYGLRQAFLKARGVLGDRTATAGLADLAANPWRHLRELGEAGLDALADRHGLATVLADLGAARPEDRLARDRLRHRAGPDATRHGPARSLADPSAGSLGGFLADSLADSLADPDRLVAHQAHTLVTDPDLLRTLLGSNPPEEAALWAVCALHRLTGDDAEARAWYERLGRPRVEVPGLPEDVRRAIVHEYAGWCEPGTDPRWRVEALCTEPPAAVDVDVQLRRVTEALSAVGIAFEPPVSAHQDNGAGEGSYHLVRLGGDEDALFASTLGPFVGGADDSPARPALERAGLRWVDEATAGTTVTGLCVYHFGERGPLTVDTLLFYWQD